MPSTDHSREHAPLLLYVEGRNAGGGCTSRVRSGDVGATANAWLGGRQSGKAFERPDRRAGPATAGAGRPAHLRRETDRRRSTTRPWCASSTRRRTTFRRARRRGGRPRARCEGSALADDRRVSPAACWRSVAAKVSSLTYSARARLRGDVSTSRRGWSSRRGTRCRRPARRRRGAGVHRRVVRHASSRRGSVSRADLLAGLADLARVLVQRRPPIAVRLG